MAQKDKHINDKRRFAKTGLGQTIDIREMGFKKTRCGFWFWFWQAGLVL